KTLGFAGHLTLEEARAQTLQAMAQALQKRLPTIAGPASGSMTLGTYIDERYEPWAVEDLRGGARYAARIRTSFPKLLGEPLSAIGVQVIEEWWRERVRVTDDRRRPVTKVTASRDLACLRSALSRAVEWQLLDT